MLEAGQRRADREFRDQSSLARSCECRREALQRTCERAGICCPDLEFRLGSWKSRVLLEDCQQDQIVSVVREDSLADGFPNCWCQALQMITRSSSSSVEPTARVWRTGRAKLSPAVHVIEAASSNLHALARPEDVASRLVPDFCLAQCPNVRGFVAMLLDDQQGRFLLNRSFLLGFLTCMAACMSISIAVRTCCFLIS